MIPIKKLIFPFLFILAIGTGCETVDRFTQFELDYTETVVVPATLGIRLPFDVYTPSISTNSEIELSINDTRKDMVESVKVKSLKASVQSPDGEDFSFLESITVYVSADGLEEIKAAWREDIPENIGNELILEVTDADLKEYILKDSFVLKISTVTDEILTDDYEIRVDATFFVDAKILGI